MPSITRVMKTSAERLGQFVDRVLDDVLNFTLGHGFFRIVTWKRGEME